jgi:hypothetical protein
VRAGGTGRPLILYLPKFAVSVPAERADTLPYFSSTPICTLRSALSAGEYMYTEQYHYAHFFGGEGYRGSKQEFLSKETKNYFLVMVHSALFTVVFEALNLFF